MKILVRENDILKFFKSKFHGRNSINNHSHWFPVRSSPKLAGIVADLMCDGHLQGEPKWRFDFTSKSKNELKRFGREIFILFGIKGKIRPCKTNKFGKTFNFGVNCKLLSRILHFIGAPTGCKVKKEFLIPEWILKDKECSRVFIRRVFTCEGSVTVERNSPFVGLEMWKAENLLDNGIKFFEQIKDNLNNFFGIKTTNVFLLGPPNLRKDGIKTRGIRLRIKRLDSLIKFWDEVKFQDPIKQNKLKQIIKIREGSKPIMGTIAI